MSKATYIIARLFEILEAEKTLLLTGQARQVVSLADDKLAAMNELEEVLGALSAESVSDGIRKSIARVMTLANENSAHFEAVRNGLRSAASRLETLGSGSLVGSYGHDGRHVSFTDATGRYLKRV